MLLTICIGRSLYINIVMWVKQRPVKCSKLLAIPMNIDIQSHTFLASLKHLGKPLMWVNPFHCYVRKFTLTIHVRESTPSPLRRCGFSHMGKVPLLCCLMSDHLVSLNLIYGGEHKYSKFVPLSWCKRL